MRGYYSEDEGILCKRLAFMVLILDGRQCICQ